MDNDDDEVLIWNGKEFVAPSTLKVGDAVVKIDDDLYELTETKTGVLKSKNSSGKYNIDGTNYVRPTSAVELDSEYESFGGDINDAFGNTIQYLLNDDNSISAIIVDETTTGTTLYGVVTGGDTDEGTSWGADDNKKVTIFTSEGTTVEYDVDEDEVTDLGTNAAAKYFGQLVEYKLNKDGEIESMKAVSTLAGAKNDKDELIEEDFGKLTGEIAIKNNAYLSAGGQNLTLADGVVAFEITQDDDDIEVNLITRAALLSGDDFTPGAVGADTDELAALDFIKQADESDSDKATDGILAAYCAYVTNSNGAVKAIAYTDADSTTYYSGIIDEWAEDGDGDVTVTFVGDDVAYEFAESSYEKLANDDDLIIYTKNGGDIAFDNEKGWAVYADKADLNSIELTGWSGGLMTLDTANYDPEVADQAEDGEKITDTIMTDSETVVYVQDKNGKYSEGTLDDITKGALVVVPVTDEDGYADVVIVDEYEGSTGIIPVEYTFELNSEKGVKIEDVKMAVGATGYNLNVFADAKELTSATDKLDYKSNEESVVTVDNKGNLVAIKVGTATITAMVDGAEVAKIKVTVTAAN